MLEAGRAFDFVSIISELECENKQVTDLNELVHVCHSVGECLTADALCQSADLFPLFHAGFFPDLRGWFIPLFL